MDSKRCDIIIKLLKERYDDHDIKYSYELQPKVDDSINLVLKLNYEGRSCYISLLKNTSMSYYYLRVKRFITKDYDRLCYVCNTNPNHCIMVRCPKCPEDICGMCYVQSYIKGRGLINFKCCKTTVGKKLPRLQYTHGLMEIMSKIKIQSPLTIYSPQ